MTISKEKRRVAFTLEVKDIEKLKALYESDKKNVDRRIYESDTLSKIINDAFKQLDNKIEGVSNK